MKKKLNNPNISNAILWAAAILSAAILDAPQFLTIIILPVCGLLSIWKSKAVPNYKKNMDKVWEDNALDLGRISAFGKVNKRNKEKEYPYNIEFGDGRTKKEMDKMQKELMECGCLPDCGCKE